MVLIIRLFTVGASRFGNLPWHFGTLSVVSGIFVYVPFSRKRSRKMGTICHSAIQKILHLSPSQRSMR